MKSALRWVERVCKARSGPCTSAGSTSVSHGRFNSQVSAVVPGEPAMSVTTSLSEPPVMFKCTMCIDRLKKGDMSVCVNPGIVRALDFGPIDELCAKYADVASIEGMPDGSEVKSAITFIPCKPKKQVVTLDTAKVRNRVRAPRANLHHGNWTGREVSRPVLPYRTG